jgi:hypothetical protein
VACFIASAKSRRRDGAKGEHWRIQGRKTAVKTNNAARWDGRRVAMANHWPPEIAALTLHAGKTHAGKAVK